MKKELTPGVNYIGITVSFYCFDERGRMLLHKRSNKCRDEKGMWDPGAGQLDFGEDPAICVLREIKEEYGCDGIIEEQLPPISVVRERGGTVTHWLAIPFIVRVRAKEAKKNEPEYMTEIGWFKLDKLPYPLHSAFEKYILKTERRKYLERYAVFNSQFKS